MKRRSRREREAVGNRSRWGSEAGARTSRVGEAKTCRAGQHDVDAHDQRHVAARVRLVSSYPRNDWGSKQGLRTAVLHTGANRGPGDRSPVRKRKTGKENEKNPQTLSIEGDECRTAYATLVSV